MATPAQAAAATVGAGSLAAAGSYGITQAVKGSSEETNTEENNTTTETPQEIKEPESKDVKTAETTYTDKTLGHKEANKPLLVDYKHADNQKWWEWAYENIFKPEKDKAQSNLNPIFQSVDKNYDPYEESPTTTKTSLNYACHKAYGLKWYDFTEENHLLDNVKLFCTKGLTSANVVEPDEEEPTTPLLLKDAGANGPNETTKFGGETTNKNHLVASVKTQDTDHQQENWWKWTYKKQFLVFKKTNPTELDAAFKKVVNAYSATAVSETAENNETSLNQACHEVYKRALALSPEALQKNAAMFCTKGPQQKETLKFA